MDLPVEYHIQFCITGEIYLCYCVVSTHLLPQITLRHVDYDLIWKHFLNSRVTHYCAAPTVQVRLDLQGMNTTSELIHRLAL